MASVIFINYRRDDSIGMAGWLHDRHAQTFGHDKPFIDVDHIPIAAGLWLDAKDGTEHRQCPR